MVGKMACLLILLLSLVPASFSQERPFAFVDVSVVPMNKELIMAHQLSS